MIDTRCKWAGTRRSLAALGALLVAALLCYSSRADDVTATWTGGAGTSTYTDPNNWDIGVVPINDANTTYMVVIPGNATVGLSVDGAFEVSDFVLPDSSTLNVGSGSTLTVLDEATVAGRITTSNGQFVAAQPGAAQITGNRARFSVSNGGMTTIAADSYSSTGRYNTYSNYADHGQTWTHDLFVSTGAGSVLDLSSLQSIDAGFNDNDQDRNIHRIVATEEGRIDLSGVKTITSPYYNSGDRLDIVVGTGGEVDLSGLETITSANGGYTRFDIDDANVTLPSLETASRVNFELNEGSTLTLDSLLSHDRGTYTVPAGAVVSSQTALNLTNVTLSLSNGGSVVMPQLNNFGGSVVTLTDTRTFETGGLQYFNNARLRVQDGAVWGVVTGDVTADSYSSTGRYNTYSNYADHGQTWTHDLFVSTGAGSVLDLSSLQSIDAGFNDNDQDRNIHRIVATEEGRIDLSGVKTITSPYYNSGDRLDIVVGTGGEVDLSGLRVIQSAGSGLSRIDLSSGGKLVLGDLVKTDRVDFRVNDMASTLRVEGNLNLWSSSSINVALLGSMEVTHSFVFHHTDESKINLAQAYLRMNGQGLQMLEVGGEDNGLPSDLGGSGNFGIGQLVVGEPNRPTTVELVDLVNNGNRGEGREALYLYGLGINEDGLVIHEGSKLIVDYLDAYAWMDGQWVHLNDWLVDGMTPLTVPMGGKYLEFDSALQSVFCEGEAIPGDATGDRCVDASDLLIVEGNWGEELPGGVGVGDFDRDGSVGHLDYLVLKANWGRSEAATPEPGTLAFLMVGALVFMRRRPHERKR